MKTKKFGLKKILITCFFGLALVFSVIFGVKVGINYNLSDYLDDSTETKIALRINNEEFGPTGNVQVMVKNVDEEKAEEIYDVLKGIDNVTNVNFDKYDTTYYVDSNALYVVLVNGDDYSDNAKAVIADIKTALTSYGEVEYGGTAVDKQKLQTTITNEMIYIMLVAICLVAGVLLLTSESWIEPIILLLTCGVAILINRGTNIFFGNISYITNSISAILQLALSIDYSIVLLHKYREKKQLISDNDQAMKESIKAVIKPISASSLTTLAGLLALLFMSFHIGFDIGIVLMKGIVISVITSLTLLPILILLSDKIMAKTKKKVICPSGKPFANFAIKWNKAIVPVAIALIGACGYLQTRTVYSFSDSNAGNSAITETFGENNSVVVLYKNQDNASSKETEFIKKINEYTTADGAGVLSNYTAYSNTVEEEYDLKTISQKMDMDGSQASLIMSMYHLYDKPDQVSLSFSDYVHYTDMLINEDEDAMENVNENLKNVIETIVKIDDCIDLNLSCEEFYQWISSFDGTEDLSLFSVEQMYGLYFYDEEFKADFQTMLNFMILCAQSDEMASSFDESVVAQLKNLSSGITSFNTQMDQEMTKTQLKGYLYSNYGVLLADDQLNQIYAGYYLSIGGETKDTIPFLSLMKYLAANGVITDENAVTTIQNYAVLYNSIHSSYDYELFIPALETIASSLSGSVVDVDVSNEAVQQIYIAYRRNIDKQEYYKINCETFLNYLLTTSEENEVINAQLPIGARDKISDMLLISSYLHNDTKYNYIDMHALLKELQNSVQSINTTENIDLAKVSGPYVKYYEEMFAGKLQTIRACDLLQFVKENMNSNSLISNKIDDAKKKKIDEADANVKKAGTLLKGENYSRLLLSLNLPNGGQETTDFVQYLETEVKNIFGDDAHVTGEIISTYDLQKAFDYDNLFITIFTIVSIFVIIMLTFKSFSLPVLLVAIIQGAIFITISTQIFSSGVFFMSYIIVTCILMGATIDYGILMSSNYVENRKTMDKKEAITAAIQSAMPTVFTSGLILIICGFVISIFSSQSSISTVGLLIGIGGLSSVLMILFVLPATLYLLDKFVMKFTINKKLSWPKKKPSGE